MSRMNDKHDYDDIPSIVPERDELVSHSQRSRPRGSASAQRPRVEDDYVPPPPRGGGGTSGAMTFLLSVLVVGMLATAGAGYFFYDQGQRALARLDDAHDRIADLERRLSAVGENSEETALNMIERIDLNFSEIDKLWAARNANRSNIADNKAAIDKVTENLGALETAVTNQARMLNENTTVLGNVQSQLDTITANISGLENLSQQLTGINRDISTVRSSMDEIESDIASRLGTIEQSIESINIFRVSQLQRLSEMQDSINQLQDRVGGP